MIYLTTYIHTLSFTERHLTTTGLHLCTSLEDTPPPPPYGLPHSLHVPPHLLSRRAHTYTLLPTIFTGLYFFAITLDDTRLRFMIPHSLHVPSFITHTHSLSLSPIHMLYFFDFFFLFLFFSLSLLLPHFIYIYIPYYYIIFNFYFRPIRRLSQNKNYTGK